MAEPGAPALPDRAWLGQLALVIRFGLVGLLNTAFGYGVFALLVLAGLPPGWALALAFVAGTLFNFVTSRRLVFRQAGNLVRFVGVYAALYVLNLAALTGLQRLGISSLVSQAALALPFAALSFLGQRFMVFRG